MEWREFLSLLFVIVLAHCESSAGRSSVARRDVRNIPIVNVEFPTYNSSGNRNVSLEEFHRPSTINFWYKAERGFMDVVQPQKPSVEFVVEVINETLSRDTTIDAAFVWNWLQKSVCDMTGEMIAFPVIEVIGVLALVIIGLLFVFGTVFGGIIFCLCQCCARDYQKHDESGAKCSRFTLSFFILVLCFSISFGIGMLATSLSDLNHSARRLPDMVEASFQQIHLMMTTTELEIDTTIRGGYYLSKELIFADLNNTDILLSEELYATFEEQKANETLLRVMAMGDELLVVIETLVGSSIEAELDAFRSEMDNMNSDLRTLAEDLVAVCQTISNDAPTTDCSAYGVYPEALQIHQFDNLTVPYDLGAAIEELKGIQAPWHNFTQDGYLQYQQIPDRIAQEIPALSRGLAEALQVVDDGIDQLTDLISNGITAVQQYIQPYQRNVVKATSYPRQYNNYIHSTGASIGLSLFFALLVSLTLLGCGVGGLAYQSKVLPTDRSGTDRLGSCCMMTVLVSTPYTIYTIHRTVYLGLLLSWLLMLLTIGLFVGGSQSHSTICPILRGSHDNFAALNQVIREVTKGNAASLNGNGNGNGSISIGSIPSLLSSCRDGATIYNALDLASREPSAAARLDTVNTVNFNESIGAIQGPLSNLTLFDNSTEDQLRRVLAIVNEMDFSPLLLELDPNHKPINQTDFSAVEVNLYELAQALNLAGQSATSSEVRQIAERLESVNARLANETEVKRRQLHAEVEQMNTRLRQFANDTNETLDAAVRLQTFAHFQLTDDDGILQTGLSDFAARLLNYLLQFVLHILNTVENDLGNCRPAYDVYDTATSFVCLHTISALNGVWFALGLILTSLLVTVFLSCCLSEYYRRAKRTNVRVEPESLQPVQRFHIVDHVNYAYH